MTTGQYGFGYVNNGAYTQIVFASASTDNGWYKYFNEAKNGDKLTCAITVRDYGNKVECYLCGNLVYTYAGEFLSNTNFQGSGYGILTLSLGSEITYYEFDVKALKKEEN